MNPIHPEDLAELAYDDDDPSGDLRAEEDPNLDTVPEILLTADTITTDKEPLF